MVDVETSGDLTRGLSLIDDPRSGSTANRTRPSSPTTTRRASSSCCWRSSAELSASDPRVAGALRHRTGADTALLSRAGRRARLRRLDRRASRLEHEGRAGPSGVGVRARRRRAARARLRAALPGSLPRRECRGAALRVVDASSPGADAFLAGSRPRSSTTTPRRLARFLAHGRARRRPLGPHRRAGAAATRNSGSPSATPRADTTRRHAPGSDPGSWPAALHEAGDARAAGGRRSGPPSADATTLLRVELLLARHPRPGVSVRRRRRAAGPLGGQPPERGVGGRHRRAAILHEPRARARLGVHPRRSPLALRRDPPHADGQRPARGAGASEPAQIPLGGYIYEACAGQDPLYRLGMLGYFETKNIGRKRERARAFHDDGRCDQRDRHGVRLGRRDAARRVRPPLAARSCWRRAGRIPSRGRPSWRSASGSSRSASTRRLDDPSRSASCAADPLVAAPHGGRRLSTVAVSSYPLAPPGSRGVLASNVPGARGSLWNIRSREGIR